MKLKESRGMRGVWYMGIFGEEKDWKMIQLYYYHKNKMVL